MKTSYRAFAFALAIVLTAEPMASAAPAVVPPPPPVPAAAAAAANNPATAIGPNGKEPMIEVSVDSLEISESDTKKIGAIWNSNSLSFFEQNIPAIFKVGDLTRDILNAKLDLLIQNNQARVLANPTLLTKSDFEATFLVGGEIPYPTVGQGGVAGVEFKKYGVILKILPRITPRSTIDATMTTNVSNPDSSVSITINGTTVPGLASREASTRVEVKDGETVVLAGIKQSNREKTITRVPVLGYIPILGLLFRHKAEKVRQTSLVLFVTFKLIRS